MRAGRRHLLTRVALCALTVALLPGTAGALWGAARAAAQPKAAAQDDRYYESVDVAVANIEVFVTDRSGKPVSGLTRDDFEVLEDGKRVEITNFLAQQEAFPANASAGTATPPGRPAAPGAAADVPERTFAVFLDNRNLEVTSRKRVLEGLAGVISRLDPRDRFVLATYDGNLTMKSFPAAEREAIVAALRRGMASGSESRVDLELLQSRVQDAIDPAEAATATDDILLWAQKRLNQVHATFAALEHCIDALAGLPGHKALMYVTSDLPLRPLEGILEASTDVLRYDASPALERVIDRANAGRVTLYGLGAPGGGHDGSARVDPARLTSLVNMAAGSGGQFSLDPNDPAVLSSQVMTDLATFYSLGYAPPPGQVGRRRHVDVRVKKAGLTARYRGSYHTKSGEESSLDRVNTALLLGEANNPLGIAVELGEAKADRKGNLTVEVTVKFPLDRLTLLPSGQEHQGKLLLFLGSRGSGGKVSKLTPIAIPLHIPDAQLAAVLKQKGGYRTRLLLRPEPCQVVVGLRDELGNSDSTLLAEWRPPAAAGK